MEERRDSYFCSAVIGEHWGPTEEPLPRVSPHLSNKKATIEHVTLKQWKGLAALLNGRNGHGVGAFLNDPQKLADGHPSPLTSCKIPS